MSVNPYSLLNPVAGIQTLVGTGTSPQQSRIYPGVSPETAALPYIEYKVITDDPISTITGTGDAHHKSFQFSCYALTYDGVQALADAIHAALEGNGHQEYRSDSYEQPVKGHTVFINWSFID